ncbi:hypothetical protein LXL04_008185 [Taraxacum kok-saghyz]
MEENEAYYIIDDVEEELSDIELIDIELEDDFTSKGNERCKDNFQNIGCNDDDLKSDNEEDNNGEEENVEEFGSEEEIDDGQASNIPDLGNEAGKYFPIHDPSVKWSKMKPILGERYGSAHQLKTCLTNYAIHKGYSIRVVKCDSGRLVARCGSKSDTNRCPFRLFASWMTEEKSFQVKTLKEAATGLDSEAATGLESQDTTGLESQAVEAAIEHQVVDEVGPQVEHQVRAMPRTMLAPRKPCERIIKRKLAKKMGGVGSSAANSLDLD